MSFGDPSRPKCTGRVPLKDADGQMLRDDNGKVKTRPCKNDPIAGGKVCRSHGGNAPQVRAKAAIVAELKAFRLDGLNPDDPGKTLLEFMQLAKQRALLYMLELEEHIAGSESLHKALIAEAWGEFGATGEYIRGLAQLEAQERDRAANLAVKAVAAGLAERQVRLAERQAEVMFELIEAALAGAGVVGPAVVAGRKAAAERLRLIQGGVGA